MTTQPTISWICFARSAAYTVFLLALAFLVACKKSNPAPNYGNNEVKATVTPLSGNVITINANGAKAVMGCGSFGGGTYVDGTNDADAAIYITTYASGGACITAPGTYSFACEYRTDIASPNAPIYGNYLASHPGSITFTTVNSGYMEGSFTAVCKRGADSVSVVGTFKGDRLGH